MRPTRNLVGVAVLIVSCVHAWATEPFSAFLDRSTRIQRVEYHPDLVVQIAGFVNTPLVIEFDKDDPVGDVAFPAGAPFEIVRKGSRLFVRPTATLKAPVTVLVTSKDKDRSYVFDFVAGTPSHFPDRVSKLVFTYPAPPIPSNRVPVAQALASAAPSIEEPAPPGLSGYRNDNYSLQVVAETADIRPREAFDDGRFTYFKFPNNIEIPAIYRSTPGAQEEWLVNSHRDGDYIVMHAVGELWTMRLSGTVLGVFNDSHEPDGVPPKKGATVGGLERAIKP